ncbi:MAG: VWA domain-containing protein, partial [Chloroflexales bacterium]|nr:VWA domain-containing protein [Chloroflexales bacterium]
RATLIAAVATPRVVAAGQAADLAGLEAALNNLVIGGAAPDLEAALALAEAALDPQLPGRIVVLTDGGATPPAARATLAPVEWIQFGAEAPNRAILAFAARQSGGKQQVYARVANYGGQPFDGVLRLFADDQPIDARPIRIAPDGEAEQTWTLPAGTGSQLQLALDGGDALPDDDVAQTSLATTRPLRIALVAAEPEPLRRALAAVPGASVTQISPENYPQPQVVDITVFDGVLPERWPNGAALLIDPPENSGLLAVEGSATVQGELVQRGALLEGLGFGGITFGTVRTITPPAWSATLLSAGETPLVLRGRDGAHELAVWAFDLRDGTLTSRLAFPLLVARTVRDLAPGGPPAALQAGAALAIRPDPQATIVELTAPDGTSQQAAGGVIASFDALALPGWYNLVERGPSGELYRMRIAVNAGTPLESSLQVAAPPQLTGSRGASQGFQARQTTELWPWLALLALVLLGGEWAYVHRRRAAGGVGAAGPQR